MQVQIAPGNVAFMIVGLADKAVAESRERVRSALIASGLALPAKRITVNLAPADLPKEGSHYDLPIALGVMAAIGAIPADALAGYTVLGELALDGSITRRRRRAAGRDRAPTRAATASICPAACGAGGGLGGARHRDPGAALAHPARQPLQGHAGDGPARAGRRAGGGGLPDLSDISGQESGKRALEIAAAGGHNLLMIGPPGAGKSMLAQRLPSILPPLDAARAARGVDDPVGRRPARRRRPVEPAAVPRAAPFGLDGGARRRRPQRAARARSRSPITACSSSTSCPSSSRRCSIRLRQPLESGEVLIARANHRVTYPARFQLVAAMNPCRCGQATEPGFACRRQPNERCMAQYQARISGPLLDRIDLVIEVPAVTAADLILPPPAEGSAEVAARVAAARAAAGPALRRSRPRRGDHQRRLPGRDRSRRWRARTATASP